jgi:phosphohistidine phosphatase
VLSLVPDNGSVPLRELVEAKFPTASIASMRWQGSDWATLGQAPVTLESFTRPRDLDPALGPEE